MRPIFKRAFNAIAITHEVVIRLGEYGVRFTSNRANIKYFFRNKEVSRSLPLYVFFNCNGKVYHKKIPIRKIWHPFISARETTARLRDYVKRYRAHNFDTTAETCIFEEIIGIRPYSEYVHIKNFYNEICLDRNVAIMHIKHQDSEYDTIIQDLSKEILSRKVH
jgi:hypothetical protein